MLESRPQRLVHAPIPCSSLPSPSRYNDAAWPRATRASLSSREGPSLGRSRHRRHIPASQAFPRSRRSDARGAGGLERARTRAHEGGPRAPCPAGASSGLLMHVPPRASLCQVSPGGVDAHSHGRVLGPSTLLQRARVATLGPLSRRRTDASPGGVGQDGRACVARGCIDAGLVLAGCKCVAHVPTCLSRTSASTSRPARVRVSLRYIGATRRPFWYLQFPLPTVTASLCPCYDAVRAQPLHLWKHRHDLKLPVSTAMANGVRLRARGSHLREHPQHARRRLRMPGSLVQHFPV